MGYNYFGNHNLLLHIPDERLNDGGLASRLLQVCQKKKKKNSRRIFNDHAVSVELWSLVQINASQKVFSQLIFVTLFFYLSLQCRALYFLVYFLIVPMYTPHSCPICTHFWLIKAFLLLSREICFRPIVNQKMSLQVPYHHHQS